MRKQVIRQTFACGHGGVKTFECGILLKSLSEF